MSYQPSLQRCIKSCNVQTGMADQFYSERVLNPRVMSCPSERNVDMYGRSVCSDTVRADINGFAGCRLATDRIEVENSLRPNYFEFVNLDARGLRGNLYSESAAERTLTNRNAYRDIGSAGYSIGDHISSHCLSHSLRAVNGGL